MRYGLCFCAGGQMAPPVLSLMWPEIRSHDGTLTELAHLTQIAFLEEVFSLSFSHTFVDVFTCKCTS